MGKSVGKTVWETVGKTVGILGKVQKKKEENRTYRACALQAKNREIFWGRGIKNKKEIVNRTV